MYMFFEMASKILGSCSSTGPVPVPVPVVPVVPVTGDRVAISNGKTSKIDRVGVRFRPGTRRVDLAILHECLFLRAASTRSTDAGGGIQPIYRQKVTELSEKVVDSNLTAAHVRACTSQQSPLSSAWRHLLFHPV